MPLCRREGAGKLTVRLLLQAESVLCRPELVGGIAKFCSTTTISRLRLASSLARTASYSGIKALSLDLPCSIDVLPSLALLRNFHNLGTLRVTLQRTTSAAGISAACQIIKTLLRVVGAQPNQLVITTDFDFSAKLAIALASARTTGHTTIVAREASQGPVFRIPPLHAANFSDRLTYGMELQRLGDLQISGHYQLTSLTLTTHHSLLEEDGTLVDRYLGHFHYDSVPNLRTLNLAMPSTVRLDFTEIEDCTLDLGQLTSLTLTGFTLMHPSLLGLAIIAPNLASLNITSWGYLGAPAHAERPEDDEDTTMCWSEMRMLTLNLWGSPTSASLMHASVFDFPMALSSLDMDAPAPAIRLPLHSSNFNFLTQLTSLRMRGVKFHQAFAPAFFQLFKLEYVMISELCVAASDYSFPAQQIGLRCPSLRQLVIGGRARSSMPHLSAAGLLRRQLLMMPGVGHRLWPNVPLVVAECSATAPNPPTYGPKLTAATIYVYANATLVRG